MIAIKKNSSAPDQKFFSDPCCKKVNRILTLRTIAALEIHIMEFAPHADGIGELTPLHAQIHEESDRPGLWSGGFTATVRYCQTNKRSGKVHRFRVVFFPLGTITESYGALQNMLEAGPSLMTF